MAGDGGFSVYVKRAKDYSIGEKVYLNFHITQHSKDLGLIKLFIKFFGCGVVNVRSNLDRCDFYIQDITSMVEKLIPHFDIYPVESLKQKDYICFRECILLVQASKHLTQDGLNRIKALSSEMNSQRLKGGGALRSPLISLLDKNNFYILLRNDVYWCIRICSMESNGGGSLSSRGGSNKFRCMLG